MTTFILYRESAKNVNQLRYKQTRRCGFFVHDVTTDNASINTTMFSAMNDGVLAPIAVHPRQPDGYDKAPMIARPLFLRYVLHIIKRVRGQFIDKKCLIKDDKITFFFKNPKHFLIFCSNI